MSLELSTNNGSPKALPESLALEKEFVYGGVIARANSYIPAKPESGYQPNQIMTIELPFEMVDLRASTLQFTITGVPAGGASFTRFNFDIRSIFQRIAIRFGSKYVLDQSNQNLLYNILDGTLDVNWAPTVGSINTGTGSTVQRNADFLNPNKVYAVQLYQNEDSWFYQVLACQKLGVQVFLDFYLASPNVCIETDVSGANYTVNNVQFHIASLVPSPSWDNLYNMRVSDNLTYTYFSYENMYDSSILSAGTTRASKVLNYKYSSLIGLIFVMQDSATLNSQTQLNKLNTYNYNNLNYLQLKIGSASFPVDTQRSLSDLLSMYAETMGLSMRFPFAQSVNFGSTNFIGCIPLAKMVKENRDINGSLNGLNVSLGTSLTLDMGFSTPLASNQTLNVFAIIENTIKYNPNGSVSFFN